MATKPEPAKTSSTGGYRDRPWIPRQLNGINLTGFARLLARNRLHIGPTRWGMAAIILGTATFNSTMRLVQAAIYGRRIRDTKLADDPIFIIGHWRSGTTLLHEYLVLDSRHTFPNTYDCMAPNHFVLTGGVLPRMLRFLMPAMRPMDNMPFGWEHPQEDEIALYNLGLPSPYLTWAFPNHPPQDPEYLDLAGVPPAALAHWHQTFLWFLKCITFRTPKRIVLKSPPHTARIKAILEMFPRARFVHIVRDPYVLFPSTVNLWKRMWRDQGLQKPNYANLNEYVFETLNHMYAAFERDRELIPASQFSQVRYEDFVADPLGQMRRIYGELNLGEFDKALPAIEKFFAGQTNYKKNRYEMAPELRDQITRRWKGYLTRYGYGPGAPKSQDAA
jgi:omega-hydroxy-beta-dihydromenaquinone-9 sulfotransferase